MNTEQIKLEILIHSGTGTLPFIMKNQILSVTNETNGGYKTLLPNI